MDASGDAAEHGRDRRTLLAGTAQNVVGLAVFVLGTFGANVLVARAFDARHPLRDALFAVGIGVGTGVPIVTSTVTALI